MSIVRGLRNPELEKGFQSALCCRIIGNLKRVRSPGPTSSDSDQTSLEQVILKVARENHWYPGFGEHQRNKYS